MVVVEHDHKSLLYHLFDLHQPAEYLPCNEARRCSMFLASELQPFGRIHGHGMHFNLHGQGHVLGDYHALY